MNGSFALMGSSAIIRHVQHLVYKIAENNAAVLITGEPGTGKDAIAKIIHEKSSRSKNPFIPIKCQLTTEGCVQTDLFEADFSTNIDGRNFSPEASNQTDGPTIYIDEIGKLGPNMQNTLLKVLQDGRIRVIGGKAETLVNVRVICGTSTDLEVLTRQGAFREDLFYRLSSSSIYLPPLRERREDIPVLSEYFIQKFNQIKAKKIIGISHDAMNALLQHNWSHNIQELENLIERIVVLKNTGSIEICDLPPRLRNLVTDNIDAFYERTNQPTNSPSNLMNPSNSAQYHNITSQTNNYSHQYDKMRIQHNNNTNQTPYNSPLKENQSIQNFNKNNVNNTQNLSNFSNTHHNQQSNFSQSNYIQSSNHSINSQNSVINTNSLSSTNHSISRPSMFDDIPNEIDQFIKKEIDLGSGIDFYRVVEEFENKLISEALRRTNHNKNRAAQLLSMNRTTLVEKLKKRATTSTIKNETGRVKRNAAFIIFDGLGSENSEFDNIDFSNVNISNEDIA